MNNYIIPFLVLMLFACNNSSDSTTGSDSSGKGDTQKIDSAYVDYSGCYRQVVGRDTILLMLDQKNDTFRGQMEFDNYEKDASHGTVKGELQSGNIMLWYDFNSEGMHSVMEVILKPVSNGLIRAIADVSNHGDTSLLQHDKLNFDASNTLYKVDCLR